MENRNLMRSRDRRVDALNIKPGPTQSGIRRTVGGIVLQPPNYLLFGLMALVALFLGFMLFRRRNWVLKLVSPLMSRLSV